MTEFQKLNAMKQTPQISMHLLVGLGNPGAEFEHTYHNVGFLALDAIAAETENAPVWKAHRKLFSYAHAGEVVLVKPLTFMNESGIAVAEALKKFGADATELTVLHDESDLVVGDFKISIGKNAAGHRGVQSIIDHLGTNEFQRVRIGIRPAHEPTRKKASAFVLSEITKKDREILEKVFKKIEEGLRIKD
jgi:PTH1 family peptidyl-tRNA hydrolase